MLADADAREVIGSTYCGRVGTVSADGWPYVVPLLHIFDGEVITLHNSAAHGHFRLNVARRSTCLFPGGRAGKGFRLRAIRMRLGPRISQCGRVRSDPDRRR